MSEVCKICGKSLGKSQYSSDGNYKSCPNCSQENGEEHVYYEYPQNFGTTLKRSSANRPEGPQSHCESCRFERDSYPTKILCSQINKA